MEPKEYVSLDGLSVFYDNLKNIFSTKKDHEADFEELANQMADLFDCAESYILNIDYNSTLAFDTSEIVFDINVSSVLGQAILGQMVLV